MNFKIFKKFPQLHYGLSEKKDGFMNVELPGDRQHSLTAKKNRQSFVEANIRGKVFIPQLKHGSEVALVSDKNWQEEIQADGFMTAQPGLFLTVTVADCFPVYIYDPVKKAIALAHAGWRGVTKNVVGNTVARLVLELGSKPKDILIAIGPGIQQCHFSIRDDIIARFTGYPGLVTVEDSQYAVDLAGIITKQAQAQGIINIEQSKLCTYCLSEDYFSYRRDKPKINKTMLAYIGLSK